MDWKGRDIKLHTEGDGEYGDEWVVEEKQMNEKWAEQRCEMDWRSKTDEWEMREPWKAWETKEMHFLMGLMEDWQIYKSEVDI